MANQEIIYGLLGVGGLLLVAAITDSSLSQTVQGHSNPVSGTSSVDSFLGTLGANGVIGGTGAGIAGAVAPGGQSLPKSAVAKNLMSYFQAQGLSKAGAAAIVGNWQQESGLNPSEQGGYLAQWLGGRLTNLEAYAAQLGQPITDWQVQAAFAMHELQSYPGLLQELQTTNDPAAAALAVSQQYERPAASAANNPAREAYAISAYKAY